MEIVDRCGKLKAVACTRKVNAMWFLLIVLLAPPSGIDRVTVLNTFATYEDCQPERNRIGFEMAESYPYENDFRIVCEFRNAGSLIRTGSSRASSDESFHPGSRLFSYAIAYGFEPR